MAYNVIKKWLQHKCFPVNIAKFLTTFFIEHFSGGSFFNFTVKGVAYVMQKCGGNKTHSLTLYHTENILWNPPILFAI